MEMLTVKGKYGTAKVYAKTVEQSALDQIKTLMDQESVNGSDIAVMPDTHSGAGCVIGFTQTIKDKVIQNLVGVDIGCFTKDTKVALTDGRNLSFEELIAECDKEHFGYSIDANGNVQVSNWNFREKLKLLINFLKLNLITAKK